MVGVILVSICNMGAHESQITTQKPFSSISLQNPVCHLKHLQDCPLRPLPHPSPEEVNMSIKQK